MSGSDSHSLAGCDWCPSHCIQWQCTVWTSQQLLTAHQNLRYKCGAAGKKNDMNWKCPISWFIIRHTIHITHLEKLPIIRDVVEFNSSMSYHQSWLLLVFQPLRPSSTSSWSNPETALPPSSCLDGKYTNLPCWPGEENLISHEKYLNYFVLCLYKQSWMKPNKINLINKDNFHLWQFNKIWQQILCKVTLYVN